MILRTIGGIGRVLVTSGVLLLSFVAYQLWGTGIETARAQDRLEEDFAQRQAAYDAQVAEFHRAAAELDPIPSSTTTSTTIFPSATTAPPTTLVPVGSDGIGIADVFGLTDEQLSEIPAPSIGADVGRIQIPEISSSWIYVEGTDQVTIQQGPGHFQQTPWPGQKGNAAIAGHRTTYGAPFHRIDELDPGDQIVVNTVQGEFVYEVMPRSELAETMPISVSPGEENLGHFIIHPTDVWILDDYDDDRITLMACHPKYNSTNRIVVVGRLLGEAAPTTPASEGVGIIGDEVDAAEIDEIEGFGETLDLLANDPEALRAALSWAAAAFSLWFLAWQVGQTWRRVKWPAYLVGSPGFALLMFTCFTHVERLLPTGY